MVKALKILLTLPVFIGLLVVWVIELYCKILIGVYKFTWENWRKLKHDLPK